MSDPKTPPTKLPRVRLALALLAIGVITLLIFLQPPVRPSSRDAPYSELVTAIDADRVKAAEITAREIHATLKVPDGTVQALITMRVPNMDERALLDAMERHGVVVTGANAEPWWLPLLPLLPWAIALLVFGLSVGSLVAGGRGRPMTFGRSRARLYDQSAENHATFADVAGVDEAKAELVEVVRFLREPARYRAVGARAPKGVLLVGAPGTGKTLLARAVAGESGVPFFSLSGSEFVEMFVGVGASRVRDLFEQAKERAPCIVFIDELDAVGKSRVGAQGVVSNDEREQTLNQLLVEMDGFDSGSGLVIMAATNRPEILDRALLRAGRFDRQVLVDRPDVREREAILRVHARRIVLAADVDFALVAQRTPGMVGADLANVVNEAALACVRHDRDEVAATDFEEAIDRIQLGLRKEARVMTADEKRRVAVHEAGHALVALSLEHADPVHRVSIIPRTIGALGTTVQLPAQERYLMTRAELRDRLCVLFGGRTAELLACGDVSSGAQDDLEHATEVARQMVCRFGMSDAFGARVDGEVSDETRRVIDTEVQKLLADAQERARALIEVARGSLDAIARELLTRETLQRAELEQLVAVRRS